MKTINFYKKNVYGVEKFYIVDETQAKLVSTLTGKKTIDESDIGALKSLGLEVKHTPIN